MNTTTIAATVYVTVEHGNGVLAEDICDCVAVSARMALGADPSCDVTEVELTEAEVIETTEDDK